MGNILDPDCPSRVILDRIGDKWTVLVVQSLSAGHSALLAVARPASAGWRPKVLTQTLRSLERDGLVDPQGLRRRCRRRSNTALTPLGRSLLGPLRALNEWAEGHIEAVLRRRRADGRTPSRPCENRAGPHARSPDESRQ